jgi:hypothetical protein
MGRRKRKEWSSSCFRVCLGILHVERMAIHLPDLWNPLEKHQASKRARAGVIGGNRVFIARRLGNGLQSVGWVDSGGGGFRR